MQEMRFKMSFMMMNDEDILQVAEALMDNCLEGSNENNHAKHTRDFTDRLKHIVTPENLAKQLSHEPRGYFTKRHFLHLFRRSNSIGIVWKQYISTTDDELINQAIFVEREHHILIDHCMIC